MSKPEYDAIIVGSGIGGAAVGALPAHDRTSIQMDMEKMEGKLPERVAGMVTSPTNYDPSLFQVLHDARG